MHGSVIQAQRRLAGFSAWSHKAKAKPFAELGSSLKILRYNVFKLVQIDGKYLIFVAVFQGHLLSAPLDNTNLFPTNPYHLETNNTKLSPPTTTRYSISIIAPFPSAFNSLCYYIESIWIIQCSLPILKPRN